MLKSYHRRYEDTEEFQFAICTNALTVQRAISSRNSINTFPLSPSFPFFPIHIPLYKLAASIAAPPNKAAAPIAPVGIAAAPVLLEEVALLAALAPLLLALSLALDTLLLILELKLLAALLTELEMDDASVPVAEARADERED